MKILFSPSETKIQYSNLNKINKNSFIFKNLYQKRLKIINLYQNYILNENDEKLAKLFGTKQEKIINNYKQNILTQKTTKAIIRYDGIGYQYLDYHSLNDNEKLYLETNVIIFSNLFGPILASDEIPDYKFSQGQKIDDFELEKYYNKIFSQSLDEFLENDDIVDLRAGFYEKFYKIKKSYISMKFIKNGKIISHWAKAYRGIILNLMSKNNIQSSDELMNLQIPNLSVKEIHKKGLQTLIIYEIYN